MDDAHVFEHNRNGMLFLLFCYVITIHGFRLQDALDTVGCLTLCRNVSELKLYSIVQGLAQKVVEFLWNSVSHDSMFQSSWIHS